jgi:hypothetical protein
VVAEPVGDVAVDLELHEAAHVAGAVLDEPGDGFHVVEVGFRHVGLELPAA